MMKGQEIGKSKPSTAKWICLPCSRQKAIRITWSGCLLTDEDLMAQEVNTENICEGCITYCKMYVESGGLITADTIAEPPPPGASGLALANAVPALANAAPSIAEFEEMQRNMHNMKRRQARLYKERREQTWGSLPEYLDPNEAAVSANLLPSAAQASGHVPGSVSSDDWDITNHELGSQFPRTFQ